MHFEEIFSQVLRCLKILKVSGNILTGYKFLALLGVTVVFEDHNLIYFINRCDPCNLADKISSQGAGLRDFEYWVWEANWEMGHFIVVILVDIVGTYHEIELFLLNLGLWLLNYHIIGLFMLTILSFFGPFGSFLGFSDLLLFLFVCGVGFLFLLSNDI